MNKINLKGNTLQVDAIEGDVTVSDGAITNAKVAANADIAATKVAVAAYAPGGITADDLQAVLEALADRIDALEGA